MVTVMAMVTVTVTVTGTGTGTGMDMATVMEHTQVMEHTVTKLKNTKNHSGNESLVYNTKSHPSPGGFFGLNAKIPMFIERSRNEGVVVNRGGFLLPPAKDWRLFMASVVNC